MMFVVDARFSFAQIGPTFDEHTTTNGSSTMIHTSTKLGNVAQMWNEGILFRVN